MRLLSFVVLSCLTLSLSGCPAPSPPASPPAAAPAGRCVHGVEAAICARCNPALKPAFVAKNDWCAEHERPESQCVICHQDLARDGVK